MRGKKNRFQAVEYASGYAVRDTETDKEAWICDGVDLLFTPSGKAMLPGSEYFRRKLKKSLNYSEEETEDAYFPKRR